VIIGEVAKMPPVERFLYWIRERHAIYERRQRGEPKPWTDDKVLQTVFFTNPYRENDKTTVWFRRNVRNPLRDDPSVLFAAVCFRWFNLIRTGEELCRLGLLLNWDEKAATRALRKLWKGGPIFTGAYMIKAGNGPPGCKLPNVCRCISNVWRDRDRLVRVCWGDCRLQVMWRELKKFDYLGPFMSYEIVCDLRYTDLLSKATDINSWSNPGPGATRGLARLEGIQLGSGVVRVKSKLRKMIRLLTVTSNKLPKLPRFELREIEHSLCEWDKYERARLGDGRLKRRYSGGSL